MRSAQSKIPSVQFLFFVFLFLLFARAAFAGHEFGNGGGVVVCRRPILKTIKSVELLDFYEARTIRNTQIDLGDTKKDWKSLVQLVIERVRPRSELRYQLYKKWFSSFESEALFLKNADFTQVSDTAHIAVPRGCQFEQAAVQKTPEFRGDPRYYISADIWAHMNDTQRAGLVLHEIIYREALGYGHTYSSRVRYFLGKLASNEIAKMNDLEFVKLLNEVHFEYADLPITAENFSSEIDVERVSRKANHEPAPEPIVLRGRMVFSVGVCGSDNCDSFSENVGAHEHLIDSLERRNGSLPFYDGTLRGQLSNEVTHIRFRKKDIMPQKCYGSEISYTEKRSYGGITFSRDDKFLQIDSYGEFTGRCEFFFQIADEDKDSVFHGSPAYYYTYTVNQEDRSRETADLFEGDLWSYYLGDSDFTSSSEARIQMGDGCLGQVFVSNKTPTSFEIRKASDSENCTGVRFNGFMQNQRDASDQLSVGFRDDGSVRWLSWRNVTSQMVGSSRSSYYWSMNCPKIDSHDEYFRSSACMSLNKEPADRAEPFAVEVNDKVTVVTEAGAFEAAP